MSKGAFYFHFSSKEELALAAFLAKQHQLLSRLAPDERASSAPAGEQLAAMLRRRNEMLAADRSLACVTRLGSEMSARSGPGSPYAAAHDSAIGLIARVLEIGMSRHELRPEIDPQAAARAIFAWVIGVDSASLSASGGADLEERSEEMLALLLPALLVDPGHSECTEKERAHDRQ